MISPTQTKVREIPEISKVALMILEPPPQPFDFKGWYGKRIAGVPLLLRNILIAQRCGFERIIFIGSDINDNFLNHLAKDSRVTIPCEYLEDPGGLQECCLDLESLMVLSGSSVLEASELKAILQSGTGYEARLFIEKLSPHISLQSLTDGLHRNSGNDKINADLQMESPVLSLIYFNPSKISKIEIPADFEFHHERLLMGCGLNNDSFMDRLVTRFLSRQFTRFFLRTPLTPNMITLISLFLGLGSAACFLMGTYASGIAGAVLLLISAWVDCTDGEVARLKFKESKIGQMLDIVSDNIVHCAVFIAIGLGLFKATGNSIYQTLGIFAVLGSLVSFAFLCKEITESKSRAAKSNVESAASSSLVESMANRDFTYFLLFMALIGQLGIFITVTAIGANVFAGYLLFIKWRPAKERHQEKLGPNINGEG